MISLDEKTEIMKGMTQLRLRKLIVAEAEREIKLSDI